MRTLAREFNAIRLSKHHEFNVDIFVEISVICLFYKHIKVSLTSVQQFRASNFTSSLWLWIDNHMSDLN